MISSMFAQQTCQQYGRFSRSVAIQAEKRIWSHADLAIRAEIPSVFVLEKISSFPQRFGQIRTESWQDF